jgi:acetyl esterase/lipase
MKSFFGQLGFCLAILAASFADASTLVPASPLPINSLSPAPSVSLLPSTRPSRILTVQWIPKGFHVVRDISYVTGAGRSRSLDLYLPDVRTNPRPLMIWIHGGGWRSGDKSAPPGLGILTRGYVVASINYRLSSEAPFPAQIFDCKAAVRFLRFHARDYGISPDRIGVWGDSAGGQLASLLGTTNGCREYEGTEGVIGPSSNVQAVCDWFGPSDFQAADDWTGPGGTAVNLLFGGSVATQSRLARFASPADQIGKGPLAPFLIMHGNQDRYVPLHQSQEFYQRLTAAGAKVRFVIIPNAGHGYGWFRNHDDLSMVYDFFDRSLAKPHVLLNIPTSRPSLQ